MLDQIRIVLVNTTHMGNVGGVARAMKNMGLQHLYIVQPQGEISDQQAIARASGAADILKNTVICESLQQAVEDCGLVVGTSARSRHIPWPLTNPRECAAKVSQVAAHDNKIAIVFGRESSGLTNEELHLCTMHVHIPTNEDFSSLNIAAAVQVLAYEMRLAWLDQQKAEENNSSQEGEPDQVVKTNWGVDWDYELANHQDLERFFVHLETTLVDIDFLDPNTPKQLMTRLRRLFQRTGLDKIELNILRGILQSVQKKAQLAEAKSATDE